AAPQGGGAGGDAPLAAPPRRALSRRRPPRLPHSRRPRRAVGDALLWSEDVKILYVASTAVLAVFSVAAAAEGHEGHGQSMPGMVMPAPHAKGAHVPTTRRSQARHGKVAGASAA